MMKLIVYLVLLSFSFPATAALSAPIDTEIEEITDSIDDKQAASESARDDIVKLKEALDELVAEYQEEYAELQEIEVAVTHKESELSNVVEQQLYYQKLLDDLNVFTYRDGDTYFVEVVLGTRSFTDLINRLDYLVKFSQRQADVLQSAKRLRMLIKKRRDELKTEKEGQRLTIEALGLKQREIQRLLARQQELIGALDQDINDLQQEKREKQELKARLAVEATARQRRVEDWPEDLVIDIIFPVPAAYASSYINDWGFARAGNPAGHQGTDIFAMKGTPLIAVADGVIGDQFGDSYIGGFRLHIIDDLGVDYYYAHLNNDTPGTDDGLGGTTAAYAPGIAPGVRVKAGQLIGYIGDSGDAEPTPPHVHFGITINDKWVPAYPYLQAATYH